MQGPTVTRRNSRPWANYTTETPPPAKRSHWQMKPESCHQILLPGSPTPMMHQETKEVDTQVKIANMSFWATSRLHRGSAQTLERRTFSWRTPPPHMHHFRRAWPHTLWDLLFLKLQHLFLIVLRKTLSQCSTNHSLTHSFFPPIKPLSSPHQAFLWPHLMIRTLENQ